MNLRRGTVVASKAGHDKGSFFVVVRIENDFVYIADGRGRKLSCPKRKNIIHLAYTNTVLGEQEMNDDSKLSEALDPFNRKTGVF